MLGIEVLYMVATRGCVSIASGGDYSLSARLSCAACDGDFCALVGPYGVVFVCFALHVVCSVLVTS